MDLIDKKSNSQIIAEYLLSKIHDGTYRQGDKLPTERLLSEQLNVSRVSVREALSGLLLLGVLESRQGSGTYVAGRTVPLMGSIFYANAVLQGTSLQDIMVARRAVESEGARCAALNRNDSDLIRLRTILEAYDKLVLPAHEGSNGIQDQIQELDISFHRSVAQAAHLKFLLGLYDTVASTLMECHRLKARATKDLVGPMSRAQESHKQILSALERQDPEKAYEAMYGHICDIIQKLF